MVTPFYLMGRAGVGGQDATTPHYSSGGSTRFRFTDSLRAQKKRNTPPPRAHNRLVRFLAVVGLVLARSVWCARSCGALASLGRQTTVPTLNLKSLGFAANFLSGAGRQSALAAPEGELAAKPRDACCVFVTRRRARQAPAKLVCNFAPAHTVQHKHITVGATLALMSYISRACAHLSMVASNFCRA